MRLSPAGFAAGIHLLLLLILLPCLGAESVLAQASVSSETAESPVEGRLVDRVVAIVGDSAIFYSQIQEQVLRLRASGMPMPEDPAGIRDVERGALDEMVDQLLVLNAAIQDTLLTVQDERLDEEAELAWEDTVQRFGTEAALLQGLEAMGVTPTQHRLNQREEIRKSLLMENYIQAQRRENRLVPIEETEIREFYERERATLGERPASVTFSQVLLAPEPSDSVKALAREEAAGLLELLDDGEDFAELARSASDDPGSASRGGELGWVRLGMMVEEFEAAAFGLDRGETSDIVETQFGAHIIQVERIRGPERMLRHILVGADPTDDDVEAARERAREIGEEVTNGALLSDFYDEGEETGLPNPMTIPLDQLGQLPSALAEALGEADQGAVIAPIELEPQPGQPAFAVAQIVELRDAGELTYEDVRPQVREILQDEQFQQQLLERLRSRSHVELRW